MWSHIFLFDSLPRRRPPEFNAILMFEFWREATATFDCSGSPVAVAPKTSLS